MDCMVAAHASIVSKRSWGDSYRTRYVAPTMAAMATSAVLQTLMFKKEIFDT